MIETEAKFKRAVAGVNEVIRVPAPEMLDINFKYKRQELIERYSHPVETDDPATLIEKGYTQESTNEGDVYYRQANEIIVFDITGRVKEHWSWPKGKAVTQLSYASYDSEGYVTSEDERIYTANPDSMVSSSLGSHRTTVRY